MAQNKPLVFISYIQEEEYLAEALQREISNLLLGGIEFFVASLPTSIEPGKRWVEEIDKALNKASAALILCSNVSMYQPWINFEAGAAWLSQALGRCSNVIPICHSGLRPSDLQAPLRNLQALDITDERDFNNLVGLLARLAGLVAPPFDSQELIARPPPSGRQLEQQQLSLQTALEITSETLRGKLDPKEIQKVVTTMVTVWSQTLYHRDQPPPPIGVSPFPSGIRLPCKLCELTSPVTAHGCCETCGLFCSDW